MSDCRFCAIIAGETPAQVVHRWPEALVIVPLNPVTRGHVLIIPTAHVEDAAGSPLIAGMTAARAAEFARWQPWSFNLITSMGTHATQTVRHLHWHYVPRRTGDGLALPWTGQAVAE